MNRIQDAIDTLDTRIKGMGGVGLNGTSLEDFETKMNLAFDEFIAFQNTQSQAFAGGKISFDESNLVYRGLGGEMYHEGDGWPKDTSLATKVIITKICSELMGINT